MSALMRSPHFTLSKQGAPKATSLDLSRAAIYRFFFLDQGHGSFVNYLQSMDSQDDWAVDFGTITPEAAADPALDALLEKLQRTISQNTIALHDGVELLVTIMSHLTTSRCMYLLRYISDNNDDFVTSFSHYLEAQSAHSADALALLRRVEAFYRAEMLSKIFSESRLTRIVRILRSSDE